MREIVVDTETTGLSPEADRIVEFAGVELVNSVPTGRHFHRYINPGQAMNAEAEAIHGLSDAFLADYPPFAEIADALLEFIGDAPLIIHNAAFDMPFINAELGRNGRPAIPMDQATCTLIMARRKFPGLQNSLDALCRRFAIDNSQRVKHGALMDAELLAAVYLELRGGRQMGLSLGVEAAAAAEAAASAAARIARPARPHAASPEELTAHAKLVEKLKTPLWLG